MSLLATSDAAPAPTIHGSVVKTGVAAPETGQTAKTGSVASDASGMPANAVSEPFYAGLIESDGKINPDSWDRLPDHLKPYKETFSRYPTFDALMAGMGNLSHLAGKKALAPLPDNAPDNIKAERNALLRSLMGAPEKAEGYGFKRPEDFPEQFWSDDYANKAASIMAEGLVSPAVARKLLELQISEAKAEFVKQDAMLAQAAKDEEIKLRSAWTGDAYDRNMHQIERLIATAGLDPKTSMPPTAEGRMGLAKIAALLSEDRLVSGDSDPNLAMGNDRARALDIINNPANPLHTAYHTHSDPRNQMARTTVFNLNESYAKRMKLAGREV